MSYITESIVEAAVIAWFNELGYTTLSAPDIAPNEPNAERQTFADVVLVRLSSALAQINPTIPADALEEALRKIVSVGLDSPNLFENNRSFHKMLTDGVPVEYYAEDQIVHDQVKLIDFDQLDNNDWLAANQSLLSKTEKIVALMFSFSLTG